MYFHPPKRLLRALIDASNRGIGIILVTNRDSGKMPWTHALFAELSRQNWQQLYEGRVKQNVSVFEYDLDFTTLHKKIIVIDGKQIFTGSSNLGKKSLESLDIELDLMMISEELGERVVENIIEDVSRSRLVPEKEAPVAGLSTAAIALGQSLFLSRFL
jgi:phosphatidylserine/phosphatidylglycerophosphate/cardiolipin synthase-like enzyme